MGYKNLILLLLILNLIIWFKVTSDLLPVFAILLCVSKEENDVAEERLEVKGER